ncbi:MAG: carotenoid 1,2-hydratase [Chlorobiales bacterium]|nr:carotenoid 1,2-hydratase [Chlorobiales bacterium]
MHISTSLEQDVWHDLKEAGSYEWWYFDAIDEQQKYSFVAIWYSGFPFSPYYITRYNKWKANGANGKGLPNPLEHTAFSFNFYENGSEVINFIKEGESHLFETSSEKPYVRFEQNEFSFDEQSQSYVLKLAFEMPSRRKMVRGEVRFSICDFHTQANVSAHSVDSYHSWILVAPKAEVTGSFEIYDGLKNKLERVSFNGNGYHDHNYGTVPMNTHIENWYWGRAHSGDLDLVYYIITYKQQVHEPFTFLLTIENDNAVVLENRMALTEHDQERNLLSPRYGKRVSLSNQDIRLMIDHKRILDTGPFYLRFESEFELHYSQGRTLKISGISEFLHPDRINSGVVRNLIKSKIWRDGKSSMMYTLYNFFNRYME